MKPLHMNNVKLRDKLLIMYVLSVFLPIVMTNVVFYQVTTTNIRNQKIRDATLALENVKASVKALVDQAAGLSYSFYADRTFNETLARRFRTPFDFVEAYDSFLKGSFSADKNVLNVMSYKVYTDNPTILSGYIVPLTDEVQSSGWYKEFKSVSLPYPSLIYDDQAFSVIQRLDYYYTNGFNPFLKIDLNMKTFGQLFQNNGFDGKVYLVNPAGQVQFSSEGDPPHDRIYFHNMDLPERSELFETRYSGINYLEGWTLHGVMNKEVVLKEVWKSRSFVFLLACINFVVPSLILAAMSRSLHVRLVRLLKYMKKVKNQNFQTIPHEEARDEIGQLTNEFNRMTERIDSLITDVYLADIQKKDLELKQQQAQLHALHSQINPHFLFNALESIRMRSVIKEEGETAEIIHKMSKILRKSISWTKDWISVAEEVEAVKTFLEIQKYRFDEELDYLIEVHQEALGVKVPNMIFLPFVENASIHGIESIPDKGVIRMSIGLERDRLVFRLSDNGIGMSPEKLEEIRRYLNRDDMIGERVGMKNAYYRLKLIYRDRFSFDIQSKEGEGTSIEISLPLTEGQP